MRQPRHTAVSGRTRQEARKWGFEDFCQRQEARITKGLTINRRQYGRGKMHVRTPAERALHLIKDFTDGMDKSHMLRETELERRK